MSGRLYTKTWRSAAGKTFAKASITEDNLAASYTTSTWSGGIEEALDLAIAEARKQMDAQKRTHDRLEGLRVVRT